MYVVEIEDCDTGERKHKVFQVSHDAVEYWSTIAAPHADDDEPQIVCKIFKAKESNTERAVALVKAGKADFFDFGGL